MASCLQVPSGTDILHFIVHTTVRVPKVRKEQLYI